MLYLDRTVRNGGPTSDLACPTCGSRGSMRYHASYRRHVVDLGPDGLPHESRVWVDRDPALADALADGLGICELPYGELGLTLDAVNRERAQRGLPPLA